MEHAKRGTCQHCGGPLELSPFSGLVSCPACEAAFWRPVRMRFFWGGVLALATVAAIDFLDSDMAVGENWGWMLGLWVVLTLFIGLGGAAGGNGGGDGGDND